MSASDHMRSTDSSQSVPDLYRFKLYNSAEIPVCIRNSIGHFVYSNSIFSDVIKGSEYDSVYWFEKLPLEIKCSLLESEVEALANPDVAIIKSVIIEGAFYWCVLFQVVHINSEVFIAWSFLKNVVFSSINSKCIAYVARNVNSLKNPALVLEPGVYQSFCLFFSGFSHEFISKLLSVTSGTSKNRISKSYSIMGVDNKDDMLLYLKFNSFLPSVHRYAFELISAKCNSLLKG